MTDSAAILAVLGLNLALAEWLVRHTALRHLGTALLVILLTAMVANLGWIPTGIAPTPAIYDGIFSWVAPLSIFWLLLEVDLRTVWRQGGRLMIVFGIGALGTAAGVWIGLQMVGDDAGLGDARAAVGGMFAGTYIGGSINFNAVALQYGVQDRGLLFTACVAVDNIVTTLWMGATLLWPRIVRGRRQGPIGGVSGERVDAVPGDIDQESVAPREVGMLLALGAGCLYASHRVQSWWPSLPWVLVLTTLALVLGHVPLVRRLRGARLLGMVSVYLFLAVIGAFCDVAELQRSGSLGGTLLLLAGITVLVHGAITVCGGALLRADRDQVAVASQACVGGGTSALALARSLGRPDLVLPAILAGAVGNAAGTYFGILIARSSG